MRSSVENLRKQVELDLQAGASGRDVCFRFAQNVEALVADCIRNTAENFAQRADASFFVLVAGGMSRRALAPRADLDLLFVTTSPSESGGGATTKEEQAFGIESILYQLWDQGLVLGHSVRSASEHLARAAQDPDLATSLLESRPLVGQEDAAQDFLQQFWREWLPEHRAALREAKKRELAERRTRFGSEAHLVEPNIKHSPGGLRDIDSLYWLSLLVRDTCAGQHTPFEVMESSGILTARAAAELRAQSDVLLALRASLHLAAGRAEDRLLFQVQDAVAALALAGLANRADFDARLPTPERAGERASEAILRHYFCASRRVKRIVDDALERYAWERPELFEGASVGPAHPFLPTSVHPIQAEIGSSEPHTDRAQELTVSGANHRKEDAPKKRRLREGFYQQGDFLFSTRQKGGPHALARIVDAVCLSSERRLRLAPALREDAYAAVGRAEPHDAATGEAFGRLFRSTRAQGDAFFCLLEMRVLGAYFADIRRLEGRFKQDGYHAYTTDAHLCHCADLALRAVATDALVPVPLREIHARLQRPYLWVLGAFFHDLGKGLPGDHSETGERIVQREAPHLGCSQEEVDTLSFLVRAHLLLSESSQRRDLSDPAVVEELAKQVRTPERLDLLALLTWVDIASVAPGMFTDWKARLLAFAVERVRAYLLDPEAGASLRGENEAEVRQRAKELLAPMGGPGEVERFVQGASIRALGSRMASELVDDFMAFQKWQGQAEAWVEVARAEGGRTHVLRVVCRDRPALLADVTTSLSGQGANILHAHIDARDDGIALDAFRIDSSRGRVLSDITLPHIVDAVQRACGEVPNHRTGKATRRARRTSPPVEPRVRIFKDFDHWGAVLVEIRADDRPGLVARISHTFSRLGWDIVLAKINTEGRVARDAFYVMPSVRTSQPDDFETLETTLLDVLHRG